MVNGITLDECTSISNFINSMNNIVDIPFPLLRTVEFTDKILTVTVDYEKICDQLNKYTTKKII